MIKDEIKQAYEDVARLWARAVGELGVGSQAVLLLSQAAEAMRDASLCAENPKLKRMSCVSIAGKGVHAWIGHGKLLCGAPIDLNETIVPWLRVPTCPDCIAILTKE